MGSNDMTHRDRENAPGRSGTARRGGRPRAIKNGGTGQWFAEVSSSRGMRTRFVDGQWVKPDAMLPGYKPPVPCRNFMSEYAMRKEDRATGDLSNVVTVESPFDPSGHCVECKAYYGHESKCGRRA